MITLILAATLCMVEPEDTTVTLDAVTVTGQKRRDYQMRTSQTTVQVGRDFLNQNFAGSLMQTLEGIPGVKAMSIGSGQSKPVIRGLGFNRLAVTEDGIKHEGQRSHTARLDIPVPANIKPGDYHFMIRLTDRVGWQQLKAVAIKIE